MKKLLSRMNRTRKKRAVAFCGLVASLLLLVAGSTAQAGVIFDESQTGAELFTNSSVDFPTNTPTVNGSSLDFVAPAHGRVMMRWNLIPAALRGDLIIVVRVDYTPLGADNDPVFAIADGTDFQGGIRTDIPHGSTTTHAIWSGEGPIGPTQIPGGYGTTTFFNIGDSQNFPLPNAAPISYTLTVPDGGVGPTVMTDVIDGVNTFPGPFSMPNNPIDSDNSLSFVLLSNVQTEHYRINSVHVTISTPELDADDDGVLDIDDNCPNDSNPGQADNDLDGDGDACDADDDDDGVLDGTDNCQFTANPGQIDLDMDGLGDACDADVDGDTICDNPAIAIGCTDGPDNCPTDPNPFQTDTDMDGAGDECDVDDDNDGVCDTAIAVIGTCDAGPDNCPTVANLDQSDAPDGDGIGDVCDADDDNDGTNDDSDNCPVVANTDQNDTDMDGAGDACDDDDDNDGVLDVDDNCQFVSNGAQADTDGNGVGDACNNADDQDGDEWSDTLDNCPTVANSDQNDLDGDGEGDACDPDIDGDSVGNGSDVCAGTPLGELVNPANGCTIAQLCPCDGPRGTNVSWKNRGKYMSCLAHATNDFVAAGLMTGEEKGALMSAASDSACGSN